MNLMSNKNLMTPQLFNFHIVSNVFQMCVADAFGIVPYKKTCLLITIMMVLKKRGSAARSLSVK